MRICYIYGIYVYTGVCTRIRHLDAYRCVYHMLSALAAMDDAPDPGPDQGKVARALFDKLRGQKLKGRAAWWSSFDVVMVSATQVKLQCLRCPEQLGAANPSARAASHLASKACINAFAVAREAATAAAAAAAAADRAEWSMRRRSPRSLFACSCRPCRKLCGRRCLR